ncbi:MAG: DNA-binding protein, partial [Lactococcus lactis]|nr:DNA-binding protein [Lactococcus lactis]
SLFPRAHEVLDEDASMLFEVMKRADGHRIPYNDKSKPEEIREYFAISKGQFKRAIGRLMKENLAEQDQDGSYLTEKAIKES